MDMLNNLQLIILIVCGIFTHTGKGQFDNFKLLDNLTSVPSIEEFVNKYVRYQGRPLNFTTISVSDDGTTDKIVVSGGGDPLEFAVPDRCGTRLTSVPAIDIHHEVGPREMIFPKCTKAMRCTGCTTKSFRSCQPLEVTQRHVQVLKLRLPSENADHFDYVDQYEIMIEDHASCMEQCIVKRDDCIARQIYIENECACRCENQEECPAVENKRWNEKTCKCECIQDFTCEGYAIFNRDTCQCDMRVLVGDISEEEIEEFINSAITNSSSVSTSTRPSSESTTTGSTATPPTTTTTTTTTAATTTTTPASTTTTTTTQAPPANTTPCSMKDCGPGWIGVITNTGICDCMPDFGGFEILLRRKKSINNRRRRRQGKI